MSDFSQSTKAMNAGKHREPWLDVVKGVCICLVAIYHSTQILEFLESTGQVSTLLVFSEQAWNTFSWALAPARMPVFFFISGLLAHKYVRTVPLKNCIQKRVINLLWLYIVWDIALWLLFYALNNFFGYQDPTYTEKLSALYEPTFTQFVITLLIENSGLWYIYALAVYFLICKLFYKLRVIVFITAISIFVYLVLDSSVGIGWANKSMFRNFSFFAFGAYWGPELLKFFDRLGFASIGTTVVLFTSAVISHKFFDVPLLLLGSFAAISFTLLFCLQTKIIFHHWIFNWLVFFGRNSLYIFIFHVFFLQSAGLILNMNVIGDLLKTDLIAIPVIALYPLLFGMLSAYLSAITGLTLRKVAPVLFMSPLKLKIAS